MFGGFILAAGPAADFNLPTRACPRRFPPHDSPHESVWQCRILNQKACQQRTPETFDSPVPHINPSGHAVAVKCQESISGQWYLTLLTSPMASVTDR